MGSVEVMISLRWISLRDRVVAGRLGLGVGIKMNVRQTIVPWF